jgi:hypothetical protein
MRTPLRAPRTALPSVLVLAADMLVGAATMPETLQFGPHTVSFDEPGIAIVKYRGFVNASDMRGMCEVPDIALHQGKFQLTLCDVSEMKGIEPEARKIGAARARPAAVYYTGYVGAGFAMRVMVTLWTRGANLMHGPKNEVGFFDDYPAAKSWLVACRQRHLHGE